VLQIFDAVVPVNAVFLQEAMDFHARLRAEQAAYLGFAEQLSPICFERHGLWNLIAALGRKLRAQSRLSLFDLLNRSDCVLAMDRAFCKLPK
jgi:hypothetical protein